MLNIKTLICCRYVLEETTQHVHVDNRDNTGRSAFMKACETGRREVVDYLLAKGASVNVEDLRHRTPLHVASENGHEDIVKILLDREANLDIQDCYTGAELCFLIRGKDKGKYPVSTVKLKNVYHPGCCPLRKRQLFIPLKQTHSMVGPWASLSCLIPFHL